MQGNRKNDPTKAGRDNLIAFLEAMGTQYMNGMAMQSMMGAGPMMAGNSGTGMMKNKGNMGDEGNWWDDWSWGEEPAQKRQKLPPVSSGNPLKDELVGKVKSFQRSGEAQKQLWWSFCDCTEGKNRDPARHEVDVLEAFVQGQGL